MRIAMVSECADPPAPAHGPEADGHDVRVPGLAAALVRHGHQVTVYTRRADPDQQETVRVEGGYDVVHVPAGPPRPMARDDLLPTMGSSPGSCSRAGARIHPTSRTRTTGCAGSPPCWRVGG